MSGSRCLPLLVLAVAACGDPQAPPDRKPEPTALLHDFGIIPHGESRTHDYAIDVEPYGVQLIPLRVQLDCSCGHAQIILRAADGSERTVDGRPFADNAIQPGETLIARVTVDTITKDPVDLPPSTSRGYVVLQPADDRSGLRRINWPLLVHFGIDSPVEVKPFEAINFEKVPQSRTPTRILTLRGDERHRGMKFGPVTCTDPAIEATLEQTGDHTHLRVRCRPDEQGNRRAALSVGTDREDGYRVNLSVTWKVVPDLEAYPMAKLSFRTQLDREQTVEQSSSQYLQVADHDLSRDVEFAVHEIVWDDGRDAASHFEVTFAPIADRPRHRRMFVRYLGGLDKPFRGRIQLTTNGDDGPFLPISLVALAIKS